jgi:TrmH family RNA methyltransferase
MNRAIQNIVSRDNEKIKYATKLKEARFQKQEQKVLIEGWNIVQEAINSQIAMEIFCLEQDLTRLSDVTCPIYTINASITQKLSDVETSQSVFAIVKIPQNAFDAASNTLVLDGIQDPGNFGTLLRSASAFGFKNIVISTGTVSPFNQKVIRSAQGLVFQLNLLQTDAKTFLQQQKNVYFTHLHTDAVPYFSVNIPTTPAILVLGNEGKGISHDVLTSVAGQNIIVPMQQNTESLNVAVAGSILMNFFYQKH